MTKSLADANSDIDAMAKPKSVSTLIVDDEPLAIRRLQALSNQIPALKIIGTAIDGNDAIDLVRSATPDLLLLDINMPGLSGVDVARLCGNLECAPAIIFTTAYSHFAVEAYELDAVDYLLKPVKSERLADAARRVLRRKAEVAAPTGSKIAAAEVSATTFLKQFLISHGNTMVPVSIDDILQIDAERDYVKLSVGDNVYYLHQSMKATEAELDPSLFVRIHRSTIVRRDRMEALLKVGRKLILRQVGGNEVLVGPSYTKRVETAFLQK